MVSRHRHAFPLFVLSSVLSVLLLCSCSNAQKNYNRGRYAEAIKQIESNKSPSSEELLLKAKSYIALGQEEKSLESLFLYLALDEDPNTENRAYAIEHFLKLNSSDKLSALVLKPTDGLQAQKALYLAYSRIGNTEKAKEMLDLLSESLGFYDYISLMLSAPHDISYVLDMFTAWNESITDKDKDAYLSLLSRFSSELNIPENDAKRFLSLTDLLMADTYYTDDDIRLSCLLKIKGNILEMLFDKVNAKIYWTQAFRLNPNDAQLKERLQQ